MEFQGALYRIEEPNLLQSSGISCMRLWEPDWSLAQLSTRRGQTERGNQILEDMLRACALDYGSSWDENLPYAEFSYNNSYQSSLKMAPFEVLYGRRCRTPLSWDEVGDCQLFGPDLIK